MGSLTDRINSILRELQEASETVNGLDKRPMQVMYRQGGQQPIAYGDPAYGAVSYAGMQTPVQPSISPPVSVMASTAEPSQPTSGKTEKADAYSASVMPDRDAGPLNLPAYSGNPLMQGIILSEILGKPLSKRPRNRYRRT